MAQLPDVFCWIKLIDDVNGKVLTDAATIGSPGKVVVRYVVANDSNKTAGPLTGVGSSCTTSHRTTESDLEERIPCL
jgi:hypothetical protein